MNEIFFSVDDTSRGDRTDCFLSEMIPDKSRSFIAQLCDLSAVEVNGRIAKKSTRLFDGDTVKIAVPDAVEYYPRAEDIPLCVVYEDSELIVVNKPKGMVVHPASGNLSGTLVNALLYHCRDSLSGINGVLRPGIVHRIDKDTSGLLVAAKTDRAHTSLSEQFKLHSVTREYRAVVYGYPKDDDGTVAAPIGRDPKSRLKMTVTSVNSRPAVTHYHVLERLTGFTYISCVLETGRTHQIRVHMASIGHPLAGDTVYGPKKTITELSGQCLHALKLGFVHPSTGEYMEFCDELPDYFTRFLNKVLIK